MRAKQKVQTLQYIDQHTVVKFYMKQFHIVNKGLIFWNKDFVHIKPLDAPNKNGYYGSYCNIIYSELTYIST